MAFGPCQSPLRVEPHDDVPPADRSNEREQERQAAAPAVGRSASSCSSAHLQKGTFLQPRLLAVAAVLSNRVERLEPRAIRLSDHFPAHAAACLCLSCAKS